jgi:hypothetical protein
MVSESGVKDSRVRGLVSFFGGFELTILAPLRLVKRWVGGIWNIGFAELDVTLTTKRSLHESYLIGSLLGCVYSSEYIGRLQK